MNDDWLKYFDERYALRTDTDFILDNLNSGWDQIEYSLESGETNGINDPDYLATLEEFAEWYRRQPKVKNVSSITETIKRLNRDMHGGDESFYKIPENRELAAQYLLLYEMSLPFGFDLNDEIDVNKSATRMVATLQNATTKELRKTDKNAREWLRNNAPADMFTFGSGMSIVWAHISERNINSMLGGAFLALVLISGIMILALRNLKIGLLSLFPNLVPAFMAFGLWGILVGQVGLGLSVVISLTLGIVVDDSVHFLSKYLRARQEFNKDPVDAVRYSFNTDGMALWITSFALIAGFFVLTLSGFRMMSDMGLMIAITISVALALDLLFLPALLMKVDRKKHRSTQNKSEIKMNTQIVKRLKLKNTITVLSVMFAVMFFTQNAAAESPEDAGLNIAIEADLKCFRQIGTN